MSEPRIGAALLAAGSSSRLGQPKQLLQLNGRPLVSHVLAQLMAAELAGCAVVLGSDAAPVAEALAASSCELLDNPDWSEGLGASIRVASRWARAARLDALLLAVCDQPRLTAAHVRALCEQHRAHRANVASGYAGTCGVPAVFSASWYPRLEALRGERGAGTLLRADPEVIVLDWPDGAWDVDTPEAAEQHGLVSRTAPRAPARS